MSDTAGLLLAELNRISGLVARWQRELPVSELEIDVTVSDNNQVGEAARFTFIWENGQFRLLKA